MASLGAGHEVRARCRRGELASNTAGLAPGLAQANLVVLPRDLAYDFLLFCQRNPKPCPLLEVTDAGDPMFKEVATNADVRTDLPRYRVWRNGKLDCEVSDMTPYWRDDSVAFLLGCSFSFEEALLQAGVPVRHQEEGRNVPMFNTAIPCKPAGVFKGNLVVSMRPMTPAQAIRAVEITARYPRVHGAPVHIGDPAVIGIADATRPDYGESVTIKEGEVCVFWACGVTPQAVIMQSAPELCVTHSPGCMFVCDVSNASLSS